MENTANAVDAKLLLSPALAAEWPPIGISAGLASQAPATPNNGYEAQQAAEPTLEEQYQGFAIEDISAAEWAAKKIARYNELKKAVDSYVDAEIARLKDYKARMDKEYDDNIDFFTMKLRPFAEKQVEGTKKKSFRLPSGMLQFRTHTDFQRDEEKLMAYVKDNAPEYLKTTVTVKWGDFKGQLKWAEDGTAISPDGEKLDFIKKVEDKTFKVEV